MSQEKIPYKDFEKLDMRVGKIISVENHPNADKLLVLKVDFKEGAPRQIIAGLKNHYTKEELMNKKAIFIANLEPAKLRGLESNGMLLAATNEDDSEITLLIPEKNIEEGSKIK